MLYCTFQSKKRHAIRDFLKFNIETGQRQNCEIPSWVFAQSKSGCHVAIHFEFLGDPDVALFFCANTQHELR